MDVVTVDESDIESWREVVAELCTAAADPLIKECLRLYDPVKPSIELKRIFKSKCTKDALLECLTFLGKENLKHMKKDDLVESSNRTSTKFFS